MKDIRELLRTPVRDLTTAEVERLKVWMSQPGVEETPEWKDVMEDR